MSVEPCDSGFTPEAIDEAETFWANLPISVGWKDLLTHEKALVIHLLARHRIAAHPGTRELREALEQAEETLDQILDDMRDDGLCVCRAVKDEAIETLAKVRAALQSPSPMEDERARIVAFIQNWTGDLSYTDELTDAIEAGEHLATIRGESKP